MEYDDMHDPLLPDQGVLRFAKRSQYGGFPIASLLVYLWEW
jgi:hypothetical protein